MCKDIQTFYSTACRLFKKCIKVNWNINLIDRCLDNSEEPPTFQAMNCMFQKMQNVKCRVLQNADLENRKMGNAVLNCYCKPVHMGTKKCSYNSKNNNPKYKLRRFMIFKIGHL